MWESKWERVATASSGGQGTGSVVVERGGGNTRYFLKELHDTTGSTERRARMYREVACYRTLTHAGIPHLIDTNAQEYAETPIPLYLVTELVEGQTLDRYVEQHGPRPAAEAIDLTCQILELMEYVHGQDAVHRDIKPDNIMLRNATPTQAVLVDFGLGFLAIEDDSLRTKVGQGLGNRFLPLPELLPGSPHKRDPRSDVTLCAGILLYLLTGKYPRTLVDEHGLLPHQRTGTRAVLAALKDVDHFALRDVLDRAFEHAINARWDSAAQLRNALRNIKTGEGAVAIPGNAKEFAKQIRQQLKSHAEQRIATFSTALERLEAIIRKGQNFAANSLDSKFAFELADTRINTPEGWMAVGVGFSKLTDSLVRFVPRFRVSIEGKEAVLRVLNPGDRVLVRGPVDDLEANEILWAQEVEKYLLKGLSEAVVSGADAGH